MAKQIVNIGTSINKGDGDPLRTAFDKINDNFVELYDVYYDTGTRKTYLFDTIGMNDSKMAAVLRHIHCFSLTTDQHQPFSTQLCPLFYSSRSWLCFYSQSAVLGQQLCIDCPKVANAMTHEVTSPTRTDSSKVRNSNISSLQNCHIGLKLRRKVVSSQK